MRNSPPEAIPSGPPKNGDPEASEIPFKAPKRRAMAGRIIHKRLRSGGKKALTAFLALSWHNPDGNHDLTQGLSVYRHSCSVAVSGRRGWRLVSDERPDWCSAGNARSPKESRLVAHKRHGSQERVSRVCGLRGVPRHKGRNSTGDAHGPGGYAGSKHGASPQA